MDAWRYGIYLLVVTFDISLVRCAHSFDIDVNTRRLIPYHISARPCIILYLSSDAKIKKEEIHRGYYTAARRNEFYFRVFSKKHSCPYNKC